MYKYNVKFNSFGTNQVFETSVYSSKNNLSTGMSDVIKGLIASREGIAVNKIKHVLSAVKA